MSAAIEPQAWPMIVGLGSDIVDIRRIAATLDRFGTRFTHRVFTAVERTRAERRLRPEETYARRFAAKEAAQRHSAPDFATGSSGATWRWSIFPPASRPSS